MDWRFTLEGDQLVEIGKHMKRMRKAMKYTQEELALKIGVARVTIIEIEKGANFSFSIFLRLLNCFDKVQEFQNIFDVSDIIPSKLYKDKL
jgi:DNA-binding XRE family transcriptional regulator